MQHAEVSTRLARLRHALALRGVRRKAKELAMRNRYATQGRCLIQALKRKPHTYMQMLAHGISTSPWKRISECLRDDEALIKGERNGLTTWRVVSATKWTD